MDESREGDRRCSGCTPWHQADYKEWVQQSMEALQLLSDHRQKQTELWLQAGPGHFSFLHGFQAFAKFLGCKSPGILRNKST